MMMKSLGSLVIALTVLTTSAGYASIPTYEKDGGYADFDLSASPSSATNFFLEDANELGSSLASAVPDGMPCDGRISSDFGWRRLSRRKGRMHVGVDIAAPYGSSVIAPANGRVAFVGRKGGYGLTVILEHGGRLTTLFAHNSKIFVKEGDEVRRGQAISRVGSTGHSTGPHVHYEVRVDGSPVNPGKYL